MPEDVGTLEALDLTHVLCENTLLLCLHDPFSLVLLDNPASSTSLALALVTLSPILIMVYSSNSRAPIYILTACLAAS